MGFHSRVAGRNDILPRTLAQCLATVFDSIDTKIAPAIISAYGLEIDAKSNSQETTKACLDFAADVSFALPTRYLTRSLAAVDECKAYLCHFNCPNPWDGSWKGYATHALDIIFVLQNYTHHLSVGQRLCAERYAKDVIAFVNGAEPWPVYSTDQPGSMVYYAPMEGNKDESEFVPTQTPEKTGRKNDLVELVGEESLDKLVEACQKFLVGPLVR
jgi:carboxylesterase type B